MRIEGAYGTGLEVTEFGGTGPGILLLHGLTDHAGTWASTARWLSAHGRVVGYDARGHGRSEHPDGPYTRDAYVGDAAAVIERLGLGPALVVAGGRSDQPVEGQREAARLLPDGRFAVLPESGHVLHREDPAGWRAAVEPFVVALLAAPGLTSAERADDHCPVSKAEV